MLTFTFTFTRTFTRARTRTRCSQWTTLAPECAACNKVEEEKQKAAPGGMNGGMSISDFLPTAPVPVGEAAAAAPPQPNPNAGMRKVAEPKKPKSGGLSILNFLHDKQSTGAPAEETQAPSVVEAVREPPQNPSVAYQIAPPERDPVYGNRLAGGETVAYAAAVAPPQPNPNAGKRKCQSIWDGDCDRSELGDADWHGQGRKRPCQSAWDGDCDRAALRELQLPSQGPTREEWANREKVALRDAAAASREHAQQQVAQDRATLLESSGLDELEPVAVPG